MIGDQAWPIPQAFNDSLRITAGKFKFFLRLVGLLLPTLLRRGWGVGER